MGDEIKRVTANYIQGLANYDEKADHKFLSPVNLKLESMTKIELPELRWLNMDSEPLTTKVANTGQTVIVSGSWSKNRPRLVGGPLQSSYVFSQLHYHWGSDNSHGSEHSYNDKKVPLEMHAVFLKESCVKQEDALAEKDGAVVVSFAYRLDKEINPGIKLVIDEIPNITNPNQLINFDDPVKLTTFLCPFKSDYFVYWGSVRTNACKHVLLWILCRQPYAVNESQLESFRALFTSGHQPIMNNSRLTHFKGYEVFHVNPSAYVADVLYKKTNNNVLKLCLTPKKIKERYLKSRTKSPSRFRDRPDSSTSTTRSILPKEKVAKTNDSEESITTNSTTTQKPSSKLDKPKLGLFESTNARQSHYQKYFSAQDKLENDKQKKSNAMFQNPQNKEDVTVMRFDANTDNRLVKDRSSLKQSKISKHVTSQNLKDKVTLKNITHQYMEARTKFKNDIFSNSSTGPKDETIDTNSLKYINLQKTNTKLDGNDEKSLFSDRLEKDVKEFGDINIDKVTFNTNLNAEATKLCYNLTNTINPDQVFGKDNTNYLKEVQEIGINTMSLDELMTSLSKNRTDKLQKCNVNQKKSDIAVVSGSGDESPSNNRNLSKSKPTCNEVREELNVKTTKVAINKRPTSSQSGYSSPSSIKVQIKCDIKKPEVYSRKEMSPASKRTSLLLRPRSPSPESSCSKQSSVTKSSSKKLKTIDYRAVKDMRCLSKDSNDTKKDTVKDTKQSRPSSKDSGKRSQTSLKGSKRNRSNSTSREQDFVKSRSSSISRPISRESSKKKSIFHSSRPSSKNSESLSREKESSNESNIQKLQTNPENKIQNKSKISQPMNRSKSNLSYRNVSRPDCFSKRPMTPNICSSQNTAKMEPLGTRNIVAANANKFTKSIDRKFEISKPVTSSSSSSDKTKTLSKPTDRFKADSNIRNTYTKTKIPLSQLQKKPSPKLIETNTNVEPINSIILSNQESYTIEQSKPEPTNQELTDHVVTDNDEIDSNQINKTCPQTINNEDVKNKNPCKLNNKPENENVKKKINTTKEVYTRIPVKLQKQIYVNGSWK